MRPNRFSRFAAAASLAFASSLTMLGGCGDNVFESNALTIHLLGVGPDSVLSGAPRGEVTLNFQVLDREGVPVGGAVARYGVEGEGGVIVTADPLTGPSGSLVVTWKLGIHASDPQLLKLTVSRGSAIAGTTVTALVKPEEVVSLALPDSLETRLSVPLLVPVLAADSYGNVFRPAGVSFTSSDTSIFVVDSSGGGIGRRRGYALAIARVGNLADTATVHIIQVAASIEGPDTAEIHSLGQLVGLSFQIISDSGYVIEDSLPTVTVSDSTVAVLVAGSLTDRSVMVRSLTNGVARLNIAMGSVSREIVLVVQQQSSTVTISPAGPVVFSALGDNVALSALARDSLGAPLSTPSFAYVSTNPAVVKVSPDGEVTSQGNGNALVVAAEATGGADTIAVTVSQVADSLEVFRTDTLSILSVGLWAPLPITCLARDRNGYPLSQSPTVQSAGGTVMGGDCATMIARQSGADTLRFSAGSHSATLAFVLAVRPLPDAPAGRYISVDSFPSGVSLWAPSARENSGTRTEIYVTGYLNVPDSNGVGPGSLHRLVSQDGFNFQYDGVVLSPETNPCTLTCSGIENIIIMPRQDAPGWRMLYAAGSSGTYGWQVFSAVSSDERNWIPEPGIRIDNGGTVPPAPPMTTPWPAGEGMIAEQLPGGEWQLIMGAYERVLPTENKFQLVDYRSTDQVNWTYKGAVLTTRELPPEAQRSIYSPGLIEFTPGLWRLIFTGDDTNLPGGRSRIFSAVSRDRQHWQLEGELLGQSGSNLYYSALVGNRLYFLRQDGAGARRLARSVLTMP